MRKLKGTFEIEFEVEIDQAVFDVVDDDFRKNLYNLQDDEDILEVIAACLLRQMSLSQLDGWANQPDSNAFLVWEDWYLSDWEELT